MSLQKTIKRILREETQLPKFLRRRVNLKNLEKSFSDALDISTTRYVRHRDKWNLMTLEKFEDMVLSTMMDDVYQTISPRWENDYFYDEIWDFLAEYFSEPIKEMYDKLSGESKQEQNESDPKKGVGKKPKGSGRRLYTDENPKDTVSVKFRTKEDIVDTLNKESFKSKPHNRQSQIINLIHQRVRVAYNNSKDPETKKRLKRAFDYIETVKEKSKQKTIRLNKQEQNESEITEKCWKGYTQKGMKTMFGKRYPNCVKKTNK